MARKKYLKDELLHQALLELAQEEVLGLKQELAQDQELAQAADRLYHENHRKVVESLRKKQARRGQPLWRYAAAVAALALVLLGTLELTRPRPDIVVLTQPTGGYTEDLGTPAPASPSLVPTLEATLAPEASPQPDVTVQISPSLTSTLETSPSPKPSPSPTPTPTLEASSSPDPSPEPAPTLQPEPSAAPSQAPDPGPAWPGSYLPRLPEDYQLSRASLEGQAAQAVFVTATGQTLHFQEYAHATTIRTGTQGDFSYHRLADGSVALARQNPEGITLLWDRDGRSFSLTGTEALDVLLAYAGSLMPAQ